MDTPNEYQSSRQSRNIMAWSVVLAGLGFIAWFGWEVCFGSLKEIVYGMARIHYGVVVGIPCSGLGALFIVLLLRNVAGNIQFKVFGFEFTGASGPIIK